ncbi:MAG TPA: hypothetical protein VKE70_24735 [Candidatus Solibacter sp.]|nr:hypothetical protein [Candidatus Solibacter sp.]
MYDHRNYYKRELGLRIQAGSPDILLEKPGVGSGRHRISSTDLRLGYGGIHTDGWCNADIYPRPAVGVVDDITELKSFENDSASRIYA